MSALRAGVVSARASGSGAALAAAAWKVASTLIENGDFAAALPYVEESREAAAGADATMAQQLGAASALCQAVLSFDEGTLAIEANHQRMLSQRASERCRLADALRSIVSFPETSVAAGNALDPEAGVQSLPFALGIVELSLPFSLRSPPRRLAVRLLGGFEVSLDGVAVGPWRHNRARLVFANIILNGRKPVSRQSLMGAFWPENSPERASNNLSLAVMTARRILDTATNGASGVISSEPGSYVIDPEVDLRVDAEVFAATADRARLLEASGRPEEAAQAFDEAVSLYRGDLLPFDIYEEWTIEPRQTLRETFAGVLSRRARLARNSHDLELAVHMTRRLLELEPSLEEAHRSLMLDYWNMGQRSRALRQMDVMRESLSRLLGVEPTEASKALYRRIADSTA